MTARQDDDDLMAETDEPARTLGTSSVRTTTRTAAVEASANGSSVADERDAGVADVPALPADSIGSPQDAPASAETGTARPADGISSGAGAGLSRGDSSPAEPSPAQQSSIPEAATVSAAAFAWDPPEPVATSPSSPARNFLRSSTDAKASAPPHAAAVTVGAAKTQAGQGTGSAHEAASASGPRPKGSSRRSARQAHLTIARVEPWSVMKFSFAVSLVAFVILFVAVSVIYGTLSALGVFTSLQHVVQSVTSSQDSTGVNAAKWFTASRVLSYTAMLGALNIVLITAMCTIGAVVYNLTSRLIGGVEVTLRETE